MKDITVLYFSVETLDLGKFWFTNYRSKCSIPIGLQDFLIVNMTGLMHQFIWLHGKVACQFVTFGSMFQGMSRNPQTCLDLPKFLWVVLGVFSFKKTIQNKRLVNFLIVLKYFFINLIPIISSYPFNCQSHKMVKYTQTIVWVCLTILWNWRLKGYRPKCTLVWKDCQIFW